MGRDSTRPSKMPKKTIIVYWLIPARPERDLLREIIRILAKQCGAPRFEPHLTIRAVAAKGKSPQTILRKIKTGPIRLRLHEVGYSATFTKTLFLRLAPSPALHGMSLDLARAAGARARVVRDPHISLLYQKLPARVKRDLAATLKLPFRHIRFDSIRAVRCAYPTRTDAEVKRWEVVATKALRVGAL
jgi:hypothetical protein